MSIRRADQDRYPDAAVSKPGDSRRAISASRQRLRRYTDKTASVLIGISGIGVLVAILAIFLYLIIEVVPLFNSARISGQSEIEAAPESGDTSLLLALEEQAEMAMRLTGEGSAEFYTIAESGRYTGLRVAGAGDHRITAHAHNDSGNNVFALGLENGKVIIGSYRFLVTYPESSVRRLLTPQLQYPFGPQPFSLFEDVAIVNITVASDDDNLLIIAQNELGEMSLLRLRQQSTLLSDYTTGSSSDGVVTELVERFASMPIAQRIFVGGQQRWLFTLSDAGMLRLYDVGTGVADEVLAVAEVPALPAGVSVGDATLLPGGMSLVIGDSRGNLAQWSTVEGDGGRDLQRLRTFSPLPQAVSLVVAEQRRKNFLAIDEGGNIALFNTTAERQLLRSRLPYPDIEAMALSPNGRNLLLTHSGNALQLIAIENDHPEISWSALWGQVWYEGYEEPDFVWQSSASSSEFEPKYSLMPLSFGTLKAAFFAMLFAAPLAVCAAIYTGYFMAPAMRRKVKPLVELMEALPTVVLGFIAGLWLAPFVERNLLGVFSILVLLPLCILLASLLWTRAPRSWHSTVPEGWEAALLLPFLLLIGWSVFALSGPVESLLFAGDIRSWVSVDLGIDYDQRNALVVGFAMGFAVIPTIYTIAEDAVFNVPRHLTYGSLALGSTPWQSLYRVVLPTASPGIFSALMIGLGRAVGETMIVLMATGNTPIMEANIFEGMRTLAANIAVEVTESEVGSTHYRLLFLTALLLFVFTFLVNTVAELVRQKLRARYSTI